MHRLGTILAAIAFAALFAWKVDTARLLAAAQPLTVSLSIAAAAVFVRLNRGMPSLEWKSISLEERELLTTRVVQIAREYAFLLAVLAVTLGVLVAITITGLAEIQTMNTLVQRALSGGVGLLAATSLSRMTYVVWRDFDIVRLQKVLIDAAGRKERDDKVAADSSDKLAAMRGANLRHFPSSSPKVLPNQ